MPVPTVNSYHNTYHCQTSKQNQDNRPTV